jgi:hypothetical protein
MAHSKCTWFIYTKGDPRTNRLIASELDEWYECRDKLCQDGASRNLWRCPSREFVCNFQRTADANKYPYDIYVREGDHGPVHRWTFDNLTKEERKKRIKKMPLKHLMEEAAALAGA